MTYLDYASDEDYGALVWAWVLVAVDEAMERAGVAVSYPHR